MSAYELAVTLRSRILNDEPDCVAVAVALMEAVLAAGDDLAVHRSLIRKLRTAMAQPGPWLLDLDEDERKEALERELSEARAALKKAESERDVYREVNASIALSNESDLANRLVVAMRELTEARAALAKVTAERDEAPIASAVLPATGCPTTVAAMATAFAIASTASLFASFTSIPRPSSACTVRRRRPRPSKRVRRG